MMPMAGALHKALKSEELPWQAWGLPTVDTRDSTMGMLCQISSHLLVGRSDMASGQKWLAGAGIPFEAWECYVIDPG